MSLLKLANELEELQQEQAQPSSNTTHAARNVGIGIGVGSLAGLRPAKSLKNVKYKPITGGIGGAIGGTSAIIGNKINASRDARRLKRQNESDAANDVPTENEL